MALPLPVLETIKKAQQKKATPTLGPAVSTVLQTATKAAPEVVKAAVPQYVPPAPTVPVSPTPAPSVVPGATVSKVIEQAYQAVPKTGLTAAQVPKVKKVIEMKKALKPKETIKAALDVTKALVTKSKAGKKFDPVTQKWLYPAKTILVGTPDQKTLEGKQLADAAVEFNKLAKKQEKKLEAVDPAKQAAQQVKGFLGGIWQKQGWVKDQFGGPYKDMPYSVLKQNFPDKVTQYEEDYQKQKKNAAFLAAVATVIDEDAKRIIGEEEIANREEAYAFRPDRGLNKVLTAMTLDTIDFEDISNVGQDVYFKDGTMHYRGIPIAQEFLTERGKSAELGASLIGSFMGAAPTYMGIASKIQKGVHSLAAAKNMPKISKMFGAFKKFDQAHPVLAEALGYNVAEEITEMIVRRGTGQDYTFTDFMNGLKYGAALGGTMKFAGKSYSEKEIKNTLAEAEETIKQTRNVDSLQTTPLGDTTLGALWREQRYAYLTGGKEGRPGIERPAPLPEVSTKVPGIPIPPQAQLKGIAAIPTKPKPTQPTVKTYNIEELKKSKEFPKVTKLRKGTKRIKGLEPGAEIADIVKVKERGGTTRITRQDLKDLQDMPELAVAKFGRKFTNPLRVFEEIGGKAKEMFYRPIKKAEGDAFKELEKLNNKFKDISKTAKESNRKASKRIMLYALSQEADGRKILNLLKETAPKLTKQEMAAYKYMRTMYDEFLDRLNKARSFAGKPPIAKRKNYFTHIRELSALEDMGIKTSTADVDTMISKGVHRNSPSFSFEKTRKGAKDIELDAFNVFNKYSDAAVKNIHLTPAISKIRELIGTKIEDPAVKAKDPEAEAVFEFKEVNPNAHAYVTRWLDHVSGQKLELGIPKAVIKPLQALNQNIVFSTLGYNLSSALIQPTALLNTMTEINPKWTIKGVKDLMGGEGKMALEKSDVLKGRVFETAIQDGKKLGRIRRAIGEAGTKPLQWLDSLTAQATWLGGYKKALAGKAKGVSKGNEKAAVAYADDLVTRTQGSASAADLAPVQRTDLGKLVTTFQTFVINNADWLRRDILGIKNPNVTKGDVFKKLSTYIIGGALLNTLYEDVMGIPSPLPRPLRAFAEEGLSGTAQELSGLLPIIGGPARFMGSRGFELEKMGGPLVSTMSDLVQGRGGALRLMGLPGASQLKKTLKGVKALEEGYKPYGVDKKILPEGLDVLRALAFGPYHIKEAKKAVHEAKKKEQWGY